MAQVNIHTPVPPLRSDGEGQTSPAPRLDGVAGKRIGFIDDMKPNAGPFVALIERMLAAEFAGIATQTVRKSLTPNMAIAHELDGDVQGVVVAWGD